MEPEECLDRRDQRVTEGSMGSLVCLEKRVTGVRRVLRGHLGLQERMEREAMMVRSDPEVCPENRVLVVCWAPKVPRGPQDLPV